ncbi:hypothetical protein REH65_16000 [Saccharopolyspora sp. ID03-671]|uniref:hypothetical protein n=1 Tax=Saccharopolyspora sp. ID03-671 TaxID=3073066 RepID=UPI0032503C89
MLTDRDIAMRMRGVIRSFEIALPDVVDGWYSAEDYERLASYLDNTARGMRSRTDLVIDAEWT